MGKKAQEYIRRVQARLPSTVKRTTELKGLSEDEQVTQMQKQGRLAVEEECIERGLVPVAVDFANTAKQCGVDVEPPAPLSPNHWVPAWYLAAWRHFNEREGEQPPDMMGSPTRDYMEFIWKVAVDEREQVLLVSELLLSYPHHGDATRRGIQAWLDDRT